MLLNYDSHSPLYIIGTGPTADELTYWISTETENDVCVISQEEFLKLSDNAQCMIGFQTIDYRINFLSNSLINFRRWPTYIHPTAAVTCSNLIGIGSVIGPNATVCHNAKLGKFCSIAPHTNIGHNAQLGDNCIVSPGVVIGGSTILGNNIYIGQSSSIKDKITICNDSRFHMTSTVTKSINYPGTYFGNRKVFLDT